jgi:hypothetical protein
MTTDSLYLRLSQASDHEAIQLLPAVAALAEADPLAELDNCLHEIASRVPLAAAALMSWLPDKPSEFVRTLVRGLSVKYLTEDAPVPFNLKGVDVGRAVLVCSRLCAEATAPAVTLGWLLALYSEVPEADPERRRLNVLLTYHVEEVPHTTLAVLNCVPANCRPAEVTAALEHLTEQESMLKDSPRLTELMLSREERYALANLERGRQRDIQRQARQRSIFMQFAKSHHVKYSTQVAIEHAAGGQIHEQTINMQEHGVFFEMPLSERAQPLLGEVTRQRLWEGKF